MEDQHFSSDGNVENLLLDLYEFILELDIVR